MRFGSDVSPPTRACHVDFTPGGHGIPPPWAYANRNQQQSRDTPTVRAVKRALAMAEQIRRGNTLGIVAQSLARGGMPGARVYAATARGCGECLIPCAFEMRGTHRRRETIRESPASSLRLSLCC